MFVICFECGQPFETDDPACDSCDDCKPDAEGEALPEIFGGGE